ncbi:hypothetical protein NDN08_001858 [Rhodosorus marinus]|uniref:Magnesium transporter n=1 Tax=Rhodosorus marinus TaxID=101924 RepID=A0AAV8UXT9_9RHOD|nr:hypothetical protein NDN08_001858 [Rhodosorus marinus]
MNWIGFAIGLVAAISTSVLSALGIALQRKSHVDEEEKPADERTAYVTRPMWLLGFGLYLACQTFGASIALGQLPTLILAPLGSVQLVFNAIFASMLSGDPFDQTDIYATALVTAGAIIVTVAGYTGEQALSISKQIELIQRRPFVTLQLAVQCLTLILLIALLFVTVRGPRNSSKNQRNRSLLSAVLAGTLQAESFIAGKCAVELLKLTIFGHDNQFGKLGSLFLLLMILVLAVSNLFFFSEALRLGSAVLCFPVCYCVFIIVSFLDSVIFFDADLSAMKIAFSAAGALIIIAGVLILSRPRRDSQPSEDETLPLVSK